MFLKAALRGFCSHCVSEGLKLQMQHLHRCCLKLPSCQISVKSNEICKLRQCHLNSGTLLVSDGQPEIPNALNNGFGREHGHKKLLWSWLRAWYRDVRNSFNSYVATYQDVCTNMSKFDTHF